MSRLAEKRAEKGWTQGQLSETSGVKFQIIQQYETGYRSIDGAKVGTLARLASALGCRIWEILEDDALRDAVRKL